MRPGMAQSVEKQDNDDKSVPRGQGPNQEGLDAHGVVQRHQNAVDDQMTTIEGSVTALDAKLDLILGENEDYSCTRSRIG